MAPWLSRITSKVGAKADMTSAEQQKGPTNINIERNDTVSARIPANGAVKYSFLLHFNKK